MSFYLRALAPVRPLPAGLLALLLLAGPALAQPTITGLNPSRNARAAARSTNVAVTFSQTMGAASSSALRVYSAQAGGRKAGPPASVVGNTVTFNPTTNFKAGETVFATVRTTAENSGGVNLATPQVFQFTTATSPSTGSFNGKYDFEPDGYINDMMVGDLTGDGILDLVICSDMDNVILVRPGYGDGSFGMPASVPFNRPTDMVMGDVNGDGDLDLVLYSYDDNLVHVLSNNGTGTLTQTSTAALGYELEHLTLADIDGDGDLDLMALKEYANDVSVQFNNGTGTFGNGFFIPPGAASVSELLLADVNADGDLDLLTVERQNDACSVHLRLNNGSGTFLAGASLPLSGVNNTVGLGDVDGDGDLDLVATDQGTRAVTLRRNNGSGTFGASTAMAINGSPTTFKLGDLDGDGDLDILASYTINEQAQVLLNNGGGVFTGGAVVDVDRSPSEIMLADIDDDGDLDLVAEGATFQGTRQVVVRLNEERFAVVAAAPVGNRPNAPVSSDIALTFNNGVGNATANQARVFGEQAGGKKNGAYTVNGSTLSFNPATDFRPGELVQVSVPGTVLSSTGQAARPNVLQFTAAATGGTGSFTAAPAVTVGALPIGATLADINGDGNLDLLVANTGDSNLAIRLGNGSGGFSGGTQATAANAGLIKTADIDADGDLDVLTVIFGNLVSVFRNNGSGTLTAAGSVAVGNSPLGLTLADVDGDGDLDLLTANRSAGTVSLRLNDGNGSFAGGTELPVGSFPSDVTAADLNHDGALDLLVANTADDNVSVLVNNGAGSFTARPTVAVGDAPRTVVVGDVDGDGDVDFLTPNAVGHTISVCLNDGLGAFSVVAALPAPGTGPTLLALGDADGDGDLDLLSNESTVALRRNNGYGSFAAATPVASMMAAGLAWGDLDNDGDLDFVATDNAASSVAVRLNQAAFTVTSVMPARNLHTAPRASDVVLNFSANVHSGTANRIRVFGPQLQGRKAGTYSAVANTLTFNPTLSFKPGEAVSVTVPSTVLSSGTNQPAKPYVYQFRAAAGAGPGTFTAGPPVPGTSGVSPVGMALADMNGDGSLDLLGTDTQTQAVSLYLGGNDGSFGAGTVVSSGMSSVHSVLTGDMDGDGDLDLVLTATLDQQARVLLNNGSGTFSPGSVLTLPNLAYVLALGDVDGDSDLDLVMNTRVFLNNGSGTLTVGSSISWSGTLGLALGDMDGDGDLDAVGTGAIRFNNGAGVFGNGYEFIHGGNPNASLLGDIDGDGDLDLVVPQADEPKSVWTYLNDGSGTLAAPTVILTPNSSCFEGALADMDGDGDLDILLDSYSNGVALLRNNGSGTFAAPELTPAPGSWYMAVGDLDNDGDLDYVTRGTSGFAVRLNASPLAITGLSPTRNRRNAGRSSSVTITFDQAMSNTAATTGAVRVFSSQRGGRVAGAASVTGNTITLDPTNDFKPGETVFTTITTAVRGTAGGTLAQPHVYQFVAAATGGTGTFVPGSDLPGAQVPYQSTLGDVDGDGDLDIVATNLNAATVDIWLNSGNATYALASSVPGLNAATAIELGDIDADGDLDLVVASGTNIMVLNNDGTGTFGGGSFVNTSLWSVNLALGDVDGDGDLDLAVAKNQGSSISLHLNNGTGTFGPENSLTMGNIPHDIALGDMDNDGDLDLLTVNTTDNTIGLRLNDGSGAFGTMSTTAVAALPLALALGDVDGDGDLDVATACSGANNLSVRRNNGNGTFSGNSNPTLPAEAYHVALADVDGDGDLDLVAATQVNGGSISRCLNNGNGTFSSSAETAMPGALNSLVMGDVDDDGDLDFVTSCPTNNTINVRLNGTAALPDLVVSTVTPVTGGPYNNVTVTGTGVGTLTANLSVAGTLLIEDGGVLNDGCFTITGPGTFVLEAGGTLGICSAQGISLAGATGTVQVSGPRIYSDDASYVYNGSQAQITGDGLPAQARNLTANNPARVRLTSDLAVRRVLTVAGAGNLQLGSRNLLLLSDASGTAMVVNSGVGIVENDGAGQATMQRHITVDAQQPYTGAGYRHYSSPVQSSRVADLATPGFTPYVDPAYNALPTPNLPAQFPNVFGYQESRLTAAYPGFDTGWYSPAALSDPLAVTKGYTVSINPTAKVVLTGTLNTGALNTGSLSRSFGPDAGWHLLGNPYPAPLDWNLVTTTPGAIPTGLADAIYVYEPTDQYAGFYRSYVNGIGTQGFNGVLPAMQGFFTRTTQAVPGGFTFQNSFRVTTYQDPAFHRQAAGAQPTLRLSLSSTTGGSDEAVVYFENGATATGLDARYDAAKLPNPGRVVSLASQMPGTGNEPLAINGLPLLVTAGPATRVPLLLSLPTAGSYRLTRQSITGFDPSLAITLVDHLLNTRTDLRQTAAYAFTASQTGPLTGRFELLLGRPGNATATTGSTELTFSAWPNPVRGTATLHLSLAAPTQHATATLRNVLGQTVATHSFSGTATEFATRGLAPGTYLLTLQVPGQAPATHRIVVE